MASCVLQSFNAQHGGIQIVNPQLAMDYPAFTMVICQHWQLKAVCGTMFVWECKNYSYFRQLRSSILLALNQTGIKQGVRLHKINDL